MTHPDLAPATGAASLPATLRLGAAHLTVSDVDRSVAWYQEALGLRVHAVDAGTARLGAGSEDVLVLHEDPQAQRAGRHAGLYHVALLYPTREELARAAVRLAATRTPIQGASDHVTHEAIYLPDPDGNGLELAADRPREVWPPTEVQYAGGPQPLDTRALLATVAGEAPSPQVRDGLAVGHLHLHVGGLDEALAFYRDVLGFELQFLWNAQAAFVSAGGYHHHLGLNTWQGVGVGGPAPHTAGLHHWTALLDDAADVAGVRARVAAAGIAVDDDATGFTVRDPWGAALRIATDG